MIFQALSQALIEVVLLLKQFLSILHLCDNTEKVAELTFDSSFFNLGHGFFAYLLNKLLHLGIGFILIPLATVYHAATG
jgi:hypothetical protein